MSYSQFKKSADEFDEIFSMKSKISKVRDYHNENLNLILSSENIVGTLKPILEKMLDKELDDLKVALIPNAGIGTDKMQMSYVYLEQFTTINNMYLKQLDIERWPKKLILDGLNKCDIISFSGGSVSRLLQAIDEINIRKEILALLRAGKPFIGFSAGAMIMSESTYFAEQFIGEPDPELAKLDPLGLVEFEVYPHFEPIMLPSIQSMLPPDSNIEAYALTANEALIVTKGELLQAGNPVYISAKS